MVVGGAWWDKREGVYTYTADPIVSCIQDNICWLYKIVGRL